MDVGVLPFSKGSRQMPTTRVGIVSLIINCNNSIALSAFFLLLDEQKEPPSEHLPTAERPQSHLTLH
jgi:hypothetical protein